MNKNITVSRFIYNYLLKKNIDHVFGYSGGAILPLLNEFSYSNNIKFIKNSNEQCSGYMSEGYTKSLNLLKPGVVLTTSGPGITNMITPLQNAFSDGSPLIVISAQVPRSSIGTDAFQECPAIQLTKNCTKWNILVDNKKDINDILDTAYNISMNPRKGPVHIDIPKDILLENINPIIKPYMLYDLYHDIPDNIYNETYKVGYMINKSTRPIIISGQGCNTSSNRLREFSIKNNIPVASTIHGMGAFSENHSLSLEMVGMHGNPAANIAVQKSNLILGLGYRFDDRTVGNLKKYAPNAINNKSIIHVDSSIDQLQKVRDIFKKHFDNTDFLISINCEVSIFLKFLNYVNIDSDFSNWINFINNFKNKYTYYSGPPSINLKGPDVIKSINNNINKLNLNRKDIYFTTGVGNHQMWASQYITWTHPNRMITSGSLGTMGVGVPFAIGSKLANNNKTVICIDGDSSFTMTSTELQTILENNINIKIAILNDGRQQMVYTWQKLFHDNNIIATINKNPNFNILADAYDIKNIKCSDKSDLDNKVKEFLTYDKSIIAVFDIEPEMCYPLVSPGKALDNMILTENDINTIDKNENAPN